MRQRVAFLGLLLLSSVGNLVAIRLVTIRLVTIVDNVTIRLVTIVDNVTIRLLTIHTLAIDDLVSIIHVVPVDVLPTILDRMTIGLVSVVDLHLIVSCGATNLISVGDGTSNLVNLSGRRIDCNCFTGGGSSSIHHPLRLLCRGCIIGGGSKSRLIRHLLLGGPSAPDDPVNGGARFEESTSFVVQ